MTDILYTDGLAKKLGKTLDAVRSMRTRCPQSLPPPDGRIGRRDYWFPENVDRWLANGGSAAKRRGRPRLVPYHITVQSS